MQEVAPHDFYVGKVLWSGVMARVGRRLRANRKASATRQPSMTGISPKPEPTRELLRAFILPVPLSSIARRERMNTRSGPERGNDEVVQAILMATIALALLVLLWLLP